MLSKEIKFKGFDGKEYVETHYFHLSKAELVLFNLEQTGGLEFYIERLMREGDNKEIIKIFKEIIDQSYGVKVPGDKTFEKTPQALLAFKSTDAYSELIMELFQNPAAAADFIRGLMPDDVQAAAKEKEAVPGFRPGFDPTQRPGQGGHIQPADSTPQHTQVVEPDPLPSEPMAAPVAAVPDSAPVTTNIFQEPPVTGEYPNLKAPQLPDFNPNGYTADQLQGLTADMVGELQARDQQITQQGYPTPPQQ